MELSLPATRNRALPRPKMALDREFVEISTLAGYAKIHSTIHLGLRYGQCMVAGTASQVLIAWKSGQRPTLQNWRTEDLNALETERMEVLESVVESLQKQDKLSSDRLRAAVRLLEHLAEGPANLPQD